MARRTKEEAQQTRNQLLNTAMTLYAEQGIHAVSLKYIASVCQVTHGALYWHFRNREDLLQQLFLIAEQPYEKQYIEQRQSVKQDPLQALHDFLMGVVHAYVEYPTYCQTYRLFLTRPYVPELTGLAEQIDESHHQVIDQIHYFLKQAKKKKQLGKKRSLKVTARGIADVLDRLVQTIAYSEDKARSSQDASIIIDLLIKGLKHP